MASEADSSTSSPESFATWDHATSSWKTFQRSFLEEWAPFSESWPRSGMTLNGAAIRLPQLVRRTDVTESSSLPTAGANDWKGSAKLGQRNGQLDEWAENLPDWIECPCCEAYICTMCFALHACLCDCPWVDDRAAPDWSTDPYSEASRGHLSPNLSEWLMGFPTEWTALDA